MKAPEALEKAAQHMRDRAATYDKPEGERSMAKTVAAFNAITGKFLSVAEGWLFMAVLKQVRVFQNPAKPHQDSLEDGVAYAALLAEEMLSAAERAAPAGPVPVVVAVQSSAAPSRNCDTCGCLSSASCKWCDPLLFSNWVPR